MKKRTDLLLRSLMFVPGHNEKLIEKALVSEADALIFDLEDSVMPVSNKEIARNTIKDYVSEPYHLGYSKISDSKKSIFVRVNDRESGELLEDVTKLTLPGVTGFVYPKSRTGKDIYFFDKLLETIEYDKGIAPGHFKIIPLIETASAVVNIQDICDSSERVIAVALGCEDFLADLEGGDDYYHSLFVPRALIAMTARATGVIPIDTVHIDVHNLKDLEENVKLAKTFGFEGMLILNPKELPLAHKYFSPSEQEINDAYEMLKLSKQAENEGKGVAVINNKFIGPPMVIAAKKLIDRSKKCKGE